MTEPKDNAQTIDLEDGTATFVVDLSLEDIAHNIVLSSTAKDKEILRFIQRIDELVADEDFTLQLAAWAKEEEAKILADREEDGEQGAT